MAILKLPHEGDTLTARIDRCAVEQGEYGDVVVFEFGDDSLYLPKLSADRQLLRAGFAIAGTPRVDYVEVMGNTLCFSRDHNARAPDKPYWRITVADGEQAAIAAVFSDMDARRDKARALKQGMQQELPTGETRPMDLPEKLDWPLFVYGALKPGFPAFEGIRPSVNTFKHDAVTGELLVRDGLPLLRKSDHGSVTGYLLHWKPGQERTGYEAVCAFEPRKHYEWSEVTLATSTQANALVIRFPDKGNPQRLDSSSWSLADDPAFGPGLETVRRVLEEVDRMPGDSRDSLDSNWPRFFRSQMAYLLLWSILERLSALCFGPGQHPMDRIKRLHELPGMEGLVRLNVQRTDRVSDSRNPKAAYKLDRTNAKKCFDYYYQVRSNLSHRGKGVFNEFDKVHGSLKELLAITEKYLAKLQEQVESQGKLP